MVKSLLQDVKKEEKLNTMNPLWNAHHQLYVVTAGADNRTPGVS
jgi:hypothetical protein